MNTPFNITRFIIIALITSIWIHIAEVARALLVAFPLIDTFFAGRIILIGPDQFNIGVALIWGGWDMLLTCVLVFVFWLCAQVFGNNLNSFMISATTTCFATIGIFWVATVNMGLGEWSTAFTLIPIAWVEMMIGALIASKLYVKYEQ